MAQLVDSLRYKPEGRGFDSRLCIWNPSSRPMGLGLTQPLTEMSIGMFPWGKGGRCIHVPTVLKSGSLNLLEPSGPVLACNGIVFLPFTNIIVSLIYVRF